MDIKKKPFLELTFFKIAKNKIFSLKKYKIMENLNVECKDLLTDQFSDYIENSFKKPLTVNTAQILTRAHYVLMDLKLSISLLEIEKYRLIPFNTVLSKYLKENKNDELAKKLQVICSERLKSL